MTRGIVLHAAVAVLVVVATFGLVRLPASAAAVPSAATAPSWVVAAFPVGQARFARARS